jgi:hypothetical protein
MLTNQEPDQNMDELTDIEVYAAIHYLEPDLLHGDGQDDRDGLVVAVTCLMVLLGLIGFIWFYV